MLHDQTVMRLKETQFQVPVVPLPEQVLKLSILPIRLVLPIQCSNSAHPQQGHRQNLNPSLVLKLQLDGKQGRGNVL